MANALVRLFHWLFTDRASGRIVIAQWPNPALWIFLAALAAGMVVRHGPAGAIVHVVGQTSLAVWAIDELLRGVNPWRRLLGGAVLVSLVTRHARLGTIPLILLCRAHANLATRIA